MQGRVKYLARLTHLRLEDKRIAKIVRCKHCEDDYTRPVLDVNAVLNFSTRACLPACLYSGKLAVLSQAVHTLPRKEPVAASDGFGRVAQNHTHLHGGL